MVRVDSEKNIDLAANSSLGGGRPGRNKRKTLKNKKKTDDEWLLIKLINLIFLIL